MNSLIILAMVIVSYVYSKTYLIDIENDKKSDTDIDARNDTNDHDQDYDTWHFSSRRQAKPESNSTCSGNLEFGWAYPSKANDNNDLNWGATDKKNSPQECQAHCNSNPRCVGYTWVDGLKNCWIKHNMDARFKDNRGPGYVSGRKNTCIGPAPWPLTSCAFKKICPGNQGVQPAAGPQPQANVGGGTPPPPPSPPPPPPPPPPAVAPELTACFPGTSMVMLDGGGKKSMGELRIGDTIMTVENGNLVPTSVLGFLNKKVNQTAYYINLILEDNRSIFISSRHVMFIKGDNNIIQNIFAKDVSIGDMVIVEDGKKSGFIPIRDITVELKMGAYVPLTHAGTLLVDGVLVSSYTNADHWLAHIVLSPLRWWPTLLLDTERSQNLEGLRIFPRMMRNLGSILGLITISDGKMETIENPVLGMPQLAMEKIDKTEI